MNKVTLGKQRLEHSSVYQEETIDHFSGRFHFLSNFYESPIKLWGIEFRTAEHAYQWAKCDNDEDRQKILNQITPGQSKSIGGSIKIRPDWEKVKVDIMTEVVTAKFTQNAHCRNMLLATGDAHIIEGNTWGDDFWGMIFERESTDKFARFTGKMIGQNILGKILENVRSILQKDQEVST